MTREAQQIVSLSGGKDSTAMLLRLLDEGESVVPVHFDTGWEFPEMHQHLDLLERQTGVEIVRLKPKRPFRYWLTERRVVARTGPKQGSVTRVGCGWPSPSRRWCTREKLNAIENWYRQHGSGPQYVGYAAGEEHRVGPTTLNAKRRGWPVRFPLIEWGMTEADALAYCRERGYRWGGLYEIFDRVSCFCCPLGGIACARKLRRYRPALWRRVLEMDARIAANRGFSHDATAWDLERRFAQEDRQLLLPASRRRF